MKCWWRQITQSYQRWILIRKFIDKIVIVLKCEKSGLGAGAAGIWCTGLVWCQKQSYIEFSAFFGHFLFRNVENPSFLPQLWLLIRLKLWEKCWQCAAMRKAPRSWAERSGVAVTRVALKRGVRGSLPSVLGSGRAELPCWVPLSMPVCLGRMEQLPKPWGGPTVSPCLGKSLLETTFHLGACEVL